MQLWRLPLKFVNFSPRIQFDRGLLPHDGNIHATEVLMYVKIRFGLDFVYLTLLAKAPVPLFSNVSHRFSTFEVAQALSYHPSHVLLFSTNNKGQLRRKVRIDVSHSHANHATSWRGPIIPIIYTAEFNCRTQIHKSNKTNIFSSEYHICTALHNEAVKGVQDVICQD